MNGGAISAPHIGVTPATIIIRGCIFNWNQASNYGGAVHAQNAILTVTYSSFYQNIEASAGGALRMSSGANNQLYLQYCNFTENVSQSNGGAVYINNGANHTIVDNLFQGNTAYYGGAMSVYSSKGTYWARNSFLNNSAILNGGAIYFYSVSVSDTFVNNTLMYNKAPQGGAIATPYAANIQDCIL